VLGNSGLKLTVLECAGETGILPINCYVSVTDICVLAYDWIAVMDASAAVLI
jgi:hypothetical protein